MLSTPIEVDGDVIGAIRSTRDAVTDFTTEQHLFDTAVGGLAALVVERHSRMQMEAKVSATASRLEHYHRELSSFMRDDMLHQTVASSGLRRLSAMCAKALAVECASIWLLAPDGKQIICLDEYDERAGTHDSGAAVDLAAHGGYFRALFRDMEVAVHDMKADALPAALQPPFAEARGIRAILDMPIFCGGRPIGLVRPASAIRATRLDAMKTACL